MRNQVFLILSLLSILQISFAQICPTFCADWAGDGACDADCNNPECNFDGGDCVECSPNCFLNSVNNAFCDLSCYNPACNFDGNDCRKCFFLFRFFIVFFYIFFEKKGKKNQR